MPVVQLTVYVTRIVAGRASGASTLTTLQINDANGDGAISREEWGAYTRSPNGHIAGETSPAALFLGDSTGNVMYGYLYTPVSYADGQDLTRVLRNLDKSKYFPTFDDLNVCYLAGTLIMTPDGEVPVETLKAGDYVSTPDHGAVRVVWTGQSRLDAETLDSCPDRRPIRIGKGSLGEGLPRRPVDVSPQHRVVVKDKSGQEVMISARHLLKAGAPGVSVLNVQSDVALVHIACERHEVLLAEGAPMESFFTGPMAIRALAPDQKAALFKEFPALVFGINPMRAARPFITWKGYQTTVGATV